MPAHSLESVLVSWVIPALDATELGTSVPKGPLPKTNVFLGWLLRGADIAADHRDRFEKHRTVKMQDVGQALQAMRREGPNLWHGPVGAQVQGFPRWAYMPLAGVASRAGAVEVARAHNRLLARKKRRHTIQGTRHLVRDYPRDADVRVPVAVLGMHVRFA